MGGGPDGLAKLCTDTVCRQAFAATPAGIDDFCNLGPASGFVAAQLGGYGGANPEEARWCVGHLYWCRQFHADASKALRLAERLFTGRLDGRKSDNTRANAFQHSFWVALMVNSRTSESNGPELAAEEYIVHEYHAFERSPYGTASSAIASRASRMDMLNNATGYHFSRTHTGHNDEYMCSNMLARNRDNGYYIDPDIDPIGWYYANDGAGKVVWRKRYTLDHVLVEPTGLDCSPA